MQEYLVVGDVGGQYDALMRLREKCPGELICVGDLVDRGPDSRKVVEFIMNGGGRSIKGNHEDLMVKAMETGDRDLWFYNGGSPTLESWGGEIPGEVVTWAKNLPLGLELPLPDGTAWLSHAFWDWNHKSAKEFDRIWDRGDCVKNSKYKWQIAGHNSHFGLRYFGNPWYGVCIDTSRSRTLTGIHLPSGKIYSVPY